MCIRDSYREDLAQAKKLIKTASICGADAIKFQTYDANVYVQHAGKSNYLSKKGLNKSVNDLFNEFSMPYRMLPKLKHYCQQFNIEFMSTPFSVNDVHAIDKFVNIHKLASFEINHIPMLHALAKTKKPIIISTGASTLDEISFALKTIKKFNHNQICLLQCTSKYPASIESLNLSVIPSLKNKYKIPVGLSDHSLDPLIAPLTAVGFGANIIEKHFTMDKKLPGPDQNFSMEPRELTMLAEQIRNIEQSLGDGIKKPSKLESEPRQFKRRGIYATTNLKSGKVLLKSDVMFLAPSKENSSVEDWPNFEGKKIASDIPKGSIILRSNLI